ncbi:hypothetical protein AAVH_07082 [Aphelenchoides avenae]|nr:hypothetical protein AAVH_07082 [Aphelenchus avenae]
MRMNRAFILAIIATTAALPAQHKEDKSIYYSDEYEDISETELDRHRKNDEPIYEDELVYPNEDYDSSQADSDRNVAAPKLSKQPSQVTEITAAKPQAGNRMKFGRYGHLGEPNKQRLQVTVIKTLKPIPTANKADVEPMDSHEAYIDETVEMPEADYDSHVAPRSGNHIPQEENQMPKAQRTSNNFDLGLQPQQTDETSREQLSREFIHETVETSEADYDSHAAAYDSGEHLPPPSLAEMHRVLGLPPPLFLDVVVDMQSPQLRTFTELRFHQMDKVYVSSVDGVMHSYVVDHEVPLAPLKSHKQLSQTTEMSEPKPPQAPMIFDPFPSRQAEKGTITPVQPEHKQFACGQPLFLFAAVILLAVVVELYRCCGARAAYQVNNIGLRRAEKCRTTEDVQSEIRYEALIENKV